MIRIRPSNERGRVNMGWLNARHSFSFGSYYDPKHMGVSALRVINQDIIAPGGGFGQHGHDNMEILTYVLRGTLSHTDTLGNRAEIRAGELQLMSAGTGIQHSEMNAGHDEVELLQIWLFPNQQNATPRYDQKTFPRTLGLTRVVAPDGRDTDALPIRQDAEIYRGLLDRDTVVQLPLATGRRAWVQVIQGPLSVNGQVLAGGDGAEISAESAVHFEAAQAAEFLYFDLP